MNRLALVLPLVLGCTTVNQRREPKGPAPFDATTLIVLEPAVDSAAARIDPVKLQIALVQAATEAAKDLKVIAPPAAAKAAQARGVDVQRVDRSGESVSQLVKDLGAGYGLFAVIDRAETTGPGALVGMVSADGDRTANWVSGDLEHLTAQLTREVGAALQDLGASSTGPVKYPSGLVLEIQQPGKGPRPRATDRVKVDYEGKLEDGTIFDSTKKRGEPAVFGLDRVIQCWNEGIPKLRPGAKATLVCPPNIAYGEKGQAPNIPPNATLHFDVELHSIEK